LCTMRRICNRRTGFVAVPQNPGAALRGLGGHCPPVGEVVPPSGNLGSFRRGWPDGPEGEDRTKKSLHFVVCDYFTTATFTYTNNILTINALRYAGLQRQSKHAYCSTLFIVCPLLFPVRSLISQRHLCFMLYDRVRL